MKSYDFNSSPHDYNDTNNKKKILILASPSVRQMLYDAWTPNNNKKKTSTKIVTEQ